MCLIGTEGIIHWYIEFNMYPCPESSYKGVRRHYGTLRIIQSIMKITEIGWVCCQLNMLILLKLTFTLGSRAFTVLISSDEV